MTEKQYLSFPNVLTDAQLRAAPVPVTTERYSGGKSASAATMTAAGNTTLVTPATGKFLRLVWILAVPNPDNLNANLIRIKFGTSGSSLYEGYAMAHWEVFDGAVNAPLVVNTQTAEAISVTVHYREITP